MIKYLKNLLNSDSASEETVSEKKKYEEKHLVVSTIEDALKLAEQRALLYPSNRVRINQYLYRSGALKGYKVIPFQDFDNEGNSSCVYIYKIGGKE